MVYCCGLASDFDDWKRAGNPGWGWGDVEPVFRSLESRIGPGGVRQDEGKLFVSSREPEYHPLKRHFYDAGRCLGIPITNDMDAAGGDCIFPYAITTRNGLRCSSADAFLKPALPRRNLLVRTATLVERIVFTGQRATGVAVRTGQESRTIRVRGEVIVSAGAIGSPVLLQRSGIGPAALLSRLGLPVVRANDHVGRHLQDHLGISYFYRATEPTLNAVLGSWPAGLPRACGTCSRVAAR